MRDIAIISELSHRTLQNQKAEYPDFPHYVAPDDLATVLRPSTRNGGLNIHCMSLAVIADNKADFVDFIRSIPAGAVIVSKENGRIHRKMPVKEFVRLWGLARRRGAAKAGGDASSAKSLVEFWNGFSRIKDRWHGAEKSIDLLKEANIRHHDTVRANLGHTRWEWRKFSHARRERVLKQIEKEARRCQINQ